MDKVHHQKETGGRAVHVQDCYVWAEIQYLDSTTDSRESVRVSDEPAFMCEEFTVEDQRTCFPWESLWAVIFIVVLAFMFLLLVARS